MIVTFSSSPFCRGHRSLCPTWWQASCHSRWVSSTLVSRLPTPKGNCLSMPALRLSPSPSSWSLLGCRAHTEDCFLQEGSSFPHFSLSRGLGIPFCKTKGPIKVCAKQVFPQRESLPRPIENFKYVDTFLLLSSKVQEYCCAGSENLHTQTQLNICFSLLLL